MTRVALLTREYPPEVYGGAGVHVEYLVRALAPHVTVDVHCFGAPREGVVGTYAPWDALAGDAPHLAALRTMSVDLAMAARVEGVDLAHSHTWYANLAGHFAKLLYDVPHVMTTHSLEPLRPWKKEQLGGGYALSSFCERTAIETADAVIAVSEGMRRDILRCYPNVAEDRVAVIHNGIDPDEYVSDPQTHVVEREGIDRSRPYVIFVGRITRQKGVVYLLEAARHFPPGVQLVLCAGEPDTKELATEVRALVDSLRGGRGDIIWIERMLPRPEIIQLLSHARAFVCPSIYEPFGIVNVEAMSCGAPVVASAVGGIPEIVVEGETGFLVSFEPGLDPFGTPRDGEAFARALADRVSRLAADEPLARRMGRAGRARVLAHFAWSAIAARTAELYSTLV